MSDRSIEILSLEYHRNGVSGEGFYAITFNDPEQEASNPFIATVFPNDLGDETEIWDVRTPTGKFLNPRVAVLSVKLLPSVQFGTNSWRGDNYAPALYEAIRKSQEPDVPATTYKLDDLTWEDIGNGWTRAEVILNEGETVTNPASTKGPIYGPAKVEFERARSGINVVVTQGVLDMTS